MDLGVAAAAALGGHGGAPDGDRGAAAEGGQCGAPVGDSGAAEDGKGGAAAVGSQGTAAGEKYSAACSGHGMDPHSSYVLNEQMVSGPGHVQTSSDIIYTTLPGCRLTKEQDNKVLEIADTMESEIPLHVAAMDRENINFNDSFVYIPLLLVVNHFKDEITKPTIQLEAPDSYLYSVGARKYSDDLVVLDSAWGSFVASQCIQEKDLLIFRSTQKSRLEVFILDPSGREKTPSCFVMGNSSSTQERSGDSSLQIVDPPPPEIFDMSSSDDDDIMSSSVKARKMASTSPPSSKSGYKTHDGASVKLGVSSEPPSNNRGGTYILGSKATLSLQMEKKVEEKVQAIGSDLPIFVKEMSRNNVDGVGCNTCEMTFCAKYGSACLPAKKQTLFLQVEGKRMLWETTFDVRGIKMRRIYKGWKEFSSQNSLEVGDVCLFKLEDRDASILKMAVYVIRKSET